MRSGSPAERGGALLCRGELRGPRAGLWGATAAAGAGERALLALLGPRYRVFAWWR